jgi:hypothetical protein
MSLHELQRAFQDRILTLSGGIERALNDSQRPDFERRLDAYVGGYRTRLVEALGTTFPVLKTTLGEDEFTRQMRLYIDSHPSRHFSVRQYGAQLEQHLSAGAQSAEASALCDLARWEWMLADVFDSPDDEPMTVAALAAVPPAAWPTLTFRLRACVRHFETGTNVVEWWRAANGLCDRPPGLDAAAPGRWLLWRRGVTTLFRSLDPLESSALTRAHAGVTFGSICEEVACFVTEDEVAVRAASMLRAWLAEELIADARPASEAE